MDLSMLSAAEMAALKSKLQSRDWVQLDADLNRVLAAGRRSGRRPASRNRKSGPSLRPARPPGILDDLALALDFAAIIDRSFGMAAKSQPKR